MKDVMTKFGQFLQDRYFNHTDLAKKTGITKYRMYNLRTKEKAEIKIDELYKVCLVLKIDPKELLEILCVDVQLPE